MTTFVTFGSLEEGDNFFARGKLHCKGSVGLFQKPPDLIERNYNAFYYDGQVGKWTHFDDVSFVQRYDKTVHSQSAAVIPFRQKVAT
jgi:hypothetical protein